MSKLCDIYCPDCGQGFPLKHDHQKKHTHIRKDQSEDACFKKPTMLTSVMKTIWKPFGNTTPGKSPAPKFVPVPVTQNGFLRPSGSGGLKRREPDLRHHPYPRRSSDDRSEVGSQTGSWISSVFNFSKWQKKQEQKSAGPSNPVLRRPSVSGNYSSPYPLPFRQPQYHSCQDYDDDNSLCTEDDIAEDEEDDDADSDRLNLKEYVQPRRRKHEQVETWVNNLKDDMDAINSLMTTDLSCDCKNGVARTRNELITKFLADSGAQVLKLQSLLSTQESYKDREVKFIRSLAKASEQTKAAMLDCSKSQQLIIYKHITEMTKLDKEEEAEDTKFAKQQAEKVEELQRKMLAETVTSDLESLLGFFS